MNDSHRKISKAAKSLQIWLGQGSIRLGCVVALVALIGFCVFCVYQSRLAKLPRHEGKSITEWFDRAVAEALPGCSMAIRDYAARKAILKMGEGAIPFLIEKAEQQPSRLADFYDQIRMRLPIWLILRLPDSGNYWIPQQRQTALNILGEVLKQQSVSQDRSAKFSADDFSDLSRCLLKCAQSNESVEIRTTAICALGYLPTSDLEITKYLTKLLSETDSTVAISAANSLGYTGPFADGTFRELKQLALTTKHYKLKFACIRATMRLVERTAPETKDRWHDEVIESFRLLHDQGDLYLRQEIAVMLWKLGDAGLVNGELNSSELWDRWCMLHRLQTESTNAMFAVFVPQVRALLQDPAPSVQQLAAATLVALDNSSGDINKIFQTSR